MKGSSLALVVTLIALSTVSPARAADPPAGPSCLPSDAALVLPLEGALVSARNAEEGLVWDARYVVDASAAFAFHGGTVRLAVPLPAGAELRPAPGLSALREPGSARIVAVCAGPEALHDRAIFATFTERVALAPGSTVKLGAPLAAGSAVQILDTWGAFPAAARGGNLDVAAGEVLERHVGFVAARGIGHAARERAREATGAGVNIAATPIYVRGDDVAAAGGLTARVTEAPARKTSSAVGIALVFGSIVLALVLAARRLRTLATVERADALLAADIDRLDPRAGRSGRAMTSESCP
jgi:hypothetical protein